MQNLGNDRRIDGQRGDETATTTLGIQNQTGLAETFCNGRWCIDEYRIGFSLNESDKPSFLDYMYDIFGDDDRWEENPDVEEYYRNKYNIELGEDIEEVDPEDKEVFCPYCYDKLEFVGYQGNIEEYNDYLETTKLSKELLKKSKRSSATK